VYTEIKTALDSYLQYLKVFKFNSIKIVGHANDSEIEFENEILSAARAGFVREYCVSNTEPKEGEGIDNNELGSNARVQIIID